MKLSIGLTAVAAFIGGCTTLTPEAASKLSSYEICEKLGSSWTRARSVVAGLEELNKRNENCSQFADIYASRQASSDRNSAALMNAASMWNDMQRTKAAQAAAAAASRPVMCTSVSNGRVTDLVCN